MAKADFGMISLGCARALVDSEKMIDRLQYGGFRLVPQGSSEEIMVLNTCSFIQSAIDETEHNIRALLQRKQQGELKYVVVAGCYPGRYKKAQLEERFPDVDLWLTTREEDKIQRELTKLVFERKFQPKRAAPYVKLTPSHFAYLKISEGCNNWCSFCTIPKIRGEHKSKPLETILQEARLQLSFGVKELIIIAEDTTCWGEDIYGKPSLPLLLTELAKLPVPWIRIMYIFPSRVDDELIRVIKDTPNICKYIDMPVQHVSSSLLSAMKRRHDRAFLEDVVRNMKREIPGLALRTTFIIGFPGETDDHVTELIDFIDAYPFAQLGCFAYSEERETLSARFAGKVEAPEIRSRLDRVMAKQFEVVHRENQALIGQETLMLYEGDGLGRSYREAPEVDSKLILTDKAPSLQIGQFYPVTITGTDAYDLLVSLNS